jgi:protease-4
MTDSDTGSNQDSSQSTEQQQKVVDRLVFAALTEQRRARRWRVFFMLFFIVYLSVVTITLMSAGDPGAGVAGKADGEQHTALVKLSGVIADDEPGGSKNVLSGLRKAFEHEDTAGIVIEINSPGGSPVQSAYIFDEIMRLKQEHESVPVYAVVTDIAASGGYFVAAAADRIYVNKSSLVGSIGVRLDAFGFVDMMKKLGIERRLLTAGDNKALFDPFLPEQQQQKDHLQAMLNQVHGHFIDAVKQGRGDRLDETQDLFSGLIWSGEQSVKLGLADAYGTTRSVARELEAEDGSSAGQRISELLFDGLSMN